MRYLSWPVVGLIVSVYGFYAVIVWQAL